jgi:hypothetical protein
MTSAELLAAIDEVLHRGFTALAAELTPAMVAAFRQRGAEILRSLKVKTDLRKVVDREAVAYAKARAGELIKEFAESTPEMLRATVEQALKDGWSTGTLRDELRADYAFSPARALSIARTETSLARRRGGQVSAKSAGARKKHWRCDGEACALCRSNEGAGWIDIDDDFPEGDDPHPNCTCGIEYSTDAVEDDAD